MKPNLKTFPFQDYLQHLPRKAKEPELVRFRNIHDVYHGWKRKLEEKLREKYAKLCETRIGNIADDAVASFIEELLAAEVDEILSEEV